uniref:Gag-pol polyprotein n=1 Tax=Solanum tuberosum TaxID=4113 RepID=M1DCJ8_SOLTU
MHTTSIIRILRHLGNISLLITLFRAVEFNTIKVSSNSCLGVSFKITLPQKVVQRCPSRRNVNPQGPEVPNSPDVQPLQGDVTNAEFRNAIQMLTQVVINQVGQQRGVRLDVADTSRIREFMRMNPLEFTRSSITEDPKNFVEELQKVF